MTRAHKKLADLCKGANSITISHDHATGETTAKIVHVKTGKVTSCRVLDHGHPTKERVVDVKVLKL